MQPRTSYNRKSSGEKLSSLLCTAGFVLSNATLKVEGGILKMQPREDIWERSLLRGRGRCGGCDHYWRICVGKLGGHRRKILTGKSKTTRGQGGCCESESNFVQLYGGCLVVARGGCELWAGHVL